MNRERLGWMAAFGLASVLAITGWIDSSRKYTAEYIRGMQEKHSRALAERTKNYEAQIIKMEEAAAQYRHEEDRKDNYCIIDSKAIVPNTPGNSDKTR